MRRLPFLLLLVLVVTACAPDPSDATPVAVALADDHIALDSATVGAGRVVFETVNESTGLVHEVEVFGGAVEGAALAVRNAVADVTYLVLIDEVENIVPGATTSLSLDLEPGTYLIICNLPEHYGNGMSAFLTVTGG